MSFYFCLKGRPKQRKCKHGHHVNGRPSKTYKTWQDMISRCSNIKKHNYHRYGGRGITVCERWLIFVNFLQDMGVKPIGLTIERIDNDKGYYKENCRWATVKEQRLNQSTTFIVNFNKKNIPLLEAYVLSKSDIPYKLVYQRVTNYKWPLERAFYKPLKARSK